VGCRADDSLIAAKILKLYGRSGAGIGTYASGGVLSAGALSEECGDMPSGGESDHPEIWRRGSARKARIPAAKRSLFFPGGISRQIST